MSMMRLSFLALFSVVGIACANGAPSSQAPASGAEIARLHRARCGACHTRVEPGDRTRDVLETAFTRHRNRVHLSDDQWGQMVDYLAAPQSTAVAAQATGPSQH
jgi:hypothetical protein